MPCTVKRRKQVTWMEAEGPNVAESRCRAVCLDHQVTPDSSSLAWMSATCSLLLRPGQEVYTQRGSMLSAAAFVYAAACSAGSSFRGSRGSRQGERRWMKQIFTGKFLILIRVCGAPFIPFTSICCHTSRAPPSRAVMALVASLFH